MSEPLIHLMFDIETLGVRSNSVVLSLACVPFSFEKRECFLDYVQKGFFVKFDVKEQIKVYNRVFSQDTIDWWKKQDKEVRRNALEQSNSDKPLRVGIIQLCKYINTTGYSFKNSYVFSRGSNFDFHIIEHLIEESVGITKPFNTWKIRDSKTAIDILCGVDNAKYDLQLGQKDEGFITHHSLHDAALEAAKLSEIYHIALEQS